MIKSRKNYFIFPLTYARYKAPEKDDVIKLTPKQFQANVSQLIRDIYPPNIQRSLRMDFPQDHKSKVEDVSEYLGRLLEAINGKQSSDNGAELRWLS